MWSHGRRHHHRCRLRQDRFVPGRRHHHAADRPDHGGVDFANLFINLSGGEYANLDAAKEAGATTINYGIFISTVLDFIIVAFAIFMVIKQMNRLKKKEEEAPAAPPAPPRQEVLLEEIRDARKR